MMQLLQFLSDHPSFVSQGFSYVVAAIVFIAHHRYCDKQHAEMQSAITDLQTNAPPSVEEILQMYNTADATLTAVNKLLRGQGRTIQARAAAMLPVAAEQQTTPVVAKRLVGGGRRNIGGMMTPPPIEPSQGAQ